MYSLQRVYLTGILFNLLDTICHVFDDTRHSKAESMNLTTCVVSFCDRFSGTMISPFANSRNLLQNKNKLKATEAAMNTTSTQLQYIQHLEDMN
mgnify:CR=1 FL=1